jgi:hypothetical protein
VLLIAGHSALNLNDVLFSLSQLRPPHRALDNSPGTTAFAVRQEATSNSGFLMIASTNDRVSRLQPGSGPTGLANKM